MHMRVHLCVCGVVKVRRLPTSSSRPQHLVSSQQLWMSPTTHCAQLPQLITLQNEGCGCVLPSLALCRQVFNFKQEKNHQVFETPGGQLMLPVKCSLWGALLP